ncbi:hypothetical protein HZS_6264 [Henneguya salminicola]|nr:hypothetical protein HZS_6264 [Henneguya salminicola]
MRNPYEQNITWKILHLKPHTTYIGTLFQKPCSLNQYSIGSDSLIFNTSGEVLKHFSITSSNSKIKIDWEILKHVKVTIKDIIIHVSSTMKERDIRMHFKKISGTFDLNSIDKMPIVSKIELAVIYSIRGLERNSYKYIIFGKTTCSGPILVAIFLTIIMFLISLMLLLIGMYIIRFSPKYKKIKKHSNSKIELNS